MCDEEFLQRGLIFMLKLITMDHMQRLFFSFLFVSGTLNGSLFKAKRNEDDLVANTRTTQVDFRLSGDKDVEQHSRFLGLDKYYLNKDPARPSSSNFSCPIGTQMETLDLKQPNDRQVL